MPRDPKPAPAPVKPATASTMVNSSPALPASVEEAYRQKCIDLKKRLKECEHSNDLLVVRNHRLRRGIQRLRLERSLLLREIERRIDPRMDDSDGTPSPPPTPREKPLRLKRSRRDGPSGGMDRADSPMSQNADGDYQRPRTPLGPPRFGPNRDRDQKPRNAYTIFCDPRRDGLMQSAAASDPEYDISLELSKAWQELTPAARQPYFDEAEDERLRHQQLRYESRMATVAFNRQQRAIAEAQKPSQIGEDGTQISVGTPAADLEGGEPMAMEEDVSGFPEQDREDSPSRPAGGFTAVNQRSNFL